MSKPVKNLMMQTYQRMFEDTDSALLVDIRGIDANQNNVLRNELAQKDIRITVIRNNLARRALADLKLAPMAELIDGPSAVVHGGESVVDVARELIAWARKIKQLQIKGAVMDGTVFGADRVEELSRFPTREEALAQVVQLVITPAADLVATVGGPGSQVVSIVDEIARRLEDNEPVAA
jgi:large subunit ribosomal protein L10